MYASPGDIEKWEEKFGKKIEIWLMIQLGAFPWSCC